jgi:hypothetical protein
LAEQNRLTNFLINEFLHPFRDPRGSVDNVRTIENPKFDNEELFFSLIDETK